MSRKKELTGILKHSSIYGIGNILHRLPPFILLPIYLNYLTPTDFGKKEIVTLVVEIMGIIISMRIAGAMARFYFEYDTEKDQNEVVSTIVLSFACIAAVLLGLVATQAQRIAALIIDSPSDKYLIIMALASLWLNTIYQMWCNYLRIKEKSIAYVTISLLKLILSLTLNIVFIVKLGYGIYGIFLSTLVSALSFTVILSVPLFFKVGMKVSLIKLKDILSFSAPMIIEQLASMVVHVSDRLFIKEFISLASAGIYTLGYRLGNSIHMLVNSPFQQTWNPRRFAIQKNDDSREIYATVFTYYLFLMFLIGTILSACAKDIILIAGHPDFYDAATVAPIITLSYIFFGAQNHFSTGLMIKKKTKYFAYIQMTVAVLNLALNFALIPKYGIMGAAYATLICMVLRFILTSWISQNIYPIQWEWKRVVRIMIAGIGAFLVCRLLQYPASIETYISNYEIYKLDLRYLGMRYCAYRIGIVMVVYLTVVFSAGFLHQKEYALLRNAMGRLKGKLF